MKEKENIEEFKDGLISELVKQGKRTLPNNDSEDQIMIKIHDMSTHRNFVSPKLKLSIRCFVAAVVLVVFLMLSVLFWASAIDYYHKMLIVAALLSICVVGIYNVENFRKIISSPL